MSGNGSVVREAGSCPDRQGTRQILRHWWLAVLLAWAASSWAEPAVQDPGVRQTNLFEAGQGGYDTYRIPALAATKQGTLLAFCEGRRNSQADSGNIDLLLRRSLDDGRTWEPMRVVVDDGANTCGNPCPILDRHTGAVILLFCKNNGSDNDDAIMTGQGAPRTVWMTTSSDEGVTWSVPVDLSPQVRKPEWRWYATGPCHGIQLRDGRLVAPCNHATSNDDADLHSHVIFSDDGGTTWQLGGNLEGRTDECTVLELADGSLYLNARNNHGSHYRAFSISQDRGATWSPLAEDPTLLEPVCQGSVLRLSAGDAPGRNRVLFSNPASVRRENLTIRVSYDECKTWPVAKVLWPGPAAYSDLVATANGPIGCLYECGEKGPREALAFALFTLEWLSGGADRLDGKPK